MNLNDLYEMRDRRDAYQRDYDHSVAGMDDHQSQAYQADGGANDERSDLDPTDWYVVKNGKMFAVSVYPNQEQQAIALGYSRTRAEARAKAGKQGVAEGSLNEVTQGVEHSEWVDNVRDAYPGVKIIKKRTEDGRHIKSQAILNGQLVGQYNMNTGVGTFKAPKQQGVAEGLEQHSPVAQAITRRILMQRTDLLAKWGPEKVGQAIDEVADSVGDVEEIGSSDVSAYVRRVEQTLDNMESNLDENILGFLGGQTKKKPVMKDPYADRLELARRERNAQSLYFKNLLAKFNSGDGMAEHEKRDLGRWLATQPGNFKAKHELEQYMDEGEMHNAGHSMDSAESGEYDYEGDMAKDDLKTIVRAARRLSGMLDDNENMPEWVQSKINKAADYVDTAADYIESNQEPELAEGGQGSGRPTLGAWDTTSGQVGRVEKTAQGIRHHADPSRYGGTEPDDEDNHLMSRSHISRLGKMTEPELDEGEKVGNMDADQFDAAMARLKQLAGAGPMKTVWDPEKRVYRNVPTAVQPKK